MTYDKHTIEFEPLPTIYNFRDLKNQTFDRLTVLGYFGKQYKTSAWYCECVCGKIVVRRTQILTQDSPHSCGCHLGVIITKNQTTHGESGKNSSPEYSSYRHAIDRCRNPRHHAFKDYGGRGIEFRFDSYEEFLKHLGRRPSLKHTLDRFPDKNGHYEKGNVRWATKKEQANHRRNSHLVTLNGITATFSEWSAHYNLPISRTSMRLQYGYCYECIFTLPKGEVCKHRSTSSPTAITENPAPTIGV